MNNKNNTIESLKTISTKKLMEKEFPPIKPVITRIMPTGTFIFAGGSKIGKSWLILWFANQIALGNPVWDFETTQSEVLYLALEDTERRLQDRLNEIASEVGAFHLATQVACIGDGFEEQVIEFIINHPKVKFIIIDTLQKIRKSGKDSATYADDYETMSAIKKIADTYDITIMILHHTKKEYDSDPFNRISGTTGIMGSADGAYVLFKKARMENKAELNITGRDVREITLDLTFDSDTCLWLLDKHSDADIMTGTDPILIAIKEFMDSHTEWKGTASKLVEDLSISGMKSNAITRKLNSNVDLLYSKFKIVYTKKRVDKEKMIFLKKVGAYDKCDSIVI